MNDCLPAQLTGHSTPNAMTWAAPAQGNRFLFFNLRK